MTISPSPASGVLALAGFSLDFQGSTLLVIILAAAGIAGAVLAYRQTTPPARPALRVALACLRSVAFILLIFLIFQPSLSRHHQMHLKPLVAAIFDDTQSLTIKDASGPRDQQLARLMRDPAWTILQDKFDLRVFAAGDSLRNLSGVIFDSMRLKTIGTDLARDWEKTAGSAGDDPFGAKILVSDGGDNAGKNPSQAAAASTVPIFTVGVGDTAAVKDASLASLSADEVAYKGKETAVTVRVRARGMAGQTAGLELLAPDGRVLARQDVKLPPDELETEATLKFTPQQAGTLPLNLRLTSAAKEVSQENNQRSFPLEVKESRIRILLVSGRPGFESLFFQRTASAITDMEVKAVTFRQDGGLYSGGSDEPGKDIARADVLVLVDFPRVDSPVAAREQLRRAYAAHPLPVWYWLGSNPALEDLRGLGGEAPFRIVHTNLQAAASAVPVRFYAELDPDAEPSETNRWKDLAPVDLPDYTVQPGSSLQTLVSFRDNATGGDLGPALVSWEGPGRRFAASFGEGYWRWSFLTGGLEGSDEMYRGYLSRVLRWLAASPKTRPLKLAADRGLYSAGETVHLGAQVLGGEGRFVSQAQVEVTLQGPEGSLNKVILEPDGQGRYAGNFVPRAVGTYTYKGLARSESDSLGADSGSFLVEAYNVEKETLNQNRPLLQAIAKASGGAYLPADSIAQLAALIKAPARVQSVGWTRRFFLNWDVWGLLVGVLCLEWFIRKRKGML